VQDVISLSRALWMDGSAKKIKIFTGYIIYYNMWPGDCYYI